MNNLIQHIIEKKEHMPKRQRAFCDYILHNPLKVSMLSITDMASETGIGTATVVRTISALGYRSVNLFKSDLRKCAFSLPLSTYNDFWTATQSSLLTLDKGDISSVIDSFVDYSKALNSLPFIEQLNAAAKMILSAQRVFILGLRSSRVFSILLENELERLDIPYVQLSDHGDTVFDKLSDITEQDLIFIIGASPITAQSAAALKICHQMNVPSILITLNQPGKLAQYASCIINLECFGIPTIYTPIVFSIELICILLQNQLDAQSKKHSEKQDAFFKQYGLKIWELEP